MIIAVVLFTIGIFYIMYGLSNITANFKSSVVFKILPFLSGFYLILSQFNSAYLYFPIVAGSIGLYFVCFSLTMKTKDIFSATLTNYMPFMSGVFLIINCLRDLNLL